MTQPVIEVVRFKLSEGTSEAAFLESANAVNAFLDATEGFVRRHLSVDPSGVWTDHIEWQSLAQAQQASKDLMAFEGAGPFMAAIEESSVDMRHNQLKLTHS